MKKFAFIIDTYPGSDGEMLELLENIKKIKSEGIEVLLTSHHPLTPEVIESSDYFIFEKKNERHFLESEILNRDLSNLEEPSFRYYCKFNNRIYFNSVIHTSFAVAIISQMFNAIKFLHSRGYEFAFYLISDFRYPSSGFSGKIEDIFDRLPNGGNYFTLHKEGFESWFSPFFFGISINDDLIKRIPNLDFSDMDVYQEHFLNMCAEDVIKKIWKDENNIVDPYEKLKEIFDADGNWNTSDSAISGSGKHSLVFGCFSDIYVNDNWNIPGFTGEKYSFFLGNLSTFESLVFEVSIFDDSGNVLYEIKREMNRGLVFSDCLDNILSGKKEIQVKKRIAVKNEEDIFVEDSIKIDLENIKGYSTLKGFTDF
jgi:hypothetical protein